MDNMHWEETTQSDYFPFFNLLTERTAVSTLNITAKELVDLVDMKNKRQIAQALNLLGSKGDSYAFIRTGPNTTSPTIKDNDIAFGDGKSDVLLGGAGDDQLWGGEGFAHCASHIGRRADWRRNAIYSRTASACQISDIARFGRAHCRIKAAT